MRAINNGSMTNESLRARRRQAPAWALLPMLAGALPGWASAEDSPPAAMEGGQLQEIIVTSTRREENLSRVPISVTALTQEDMDTKGIKDILDVARFTPGINVDNSGSNNISIRGIASSGGAGTTGIYIDDTPIQMRALAFNPDETLPKSFDVARVEVLRGPQGTLFGAGSEGGTVRYITTQPSLTKTSIYGRSEFSFTQGGEPSYEAGLAAGGPIIEGTLGARATVWFRRDGGWIDRVDPTAANPQSAVVDKNANHGQTLLLRLAAVWAPGAEWTVTPSIYYQDRQLHDVSTYWPIYSNPNSDSYISGNPTQRSSPDRFYLPALKIERDFDAFHVISNTSYFHRKEQTGYDGTLYNLGFYQSFNSNTLPDSGFVAFDPSLPWPMLDGNGVHLPASLAGYRSPASIDNGQQNFTEELRLVSSNPAARFSWTTGLFFSSNRQSYLELIHDPQLENFWETVAGVSYLDVFTDIDGNPVPFEAAFPTESYFLQTHSKDQQIAWYGEGTLSITEALKLTVGLRFSRTEFSFNTLTGGPQLFNAPLANDGDKKENAFTPKVNLAYQMDQNNLFYATYAKGFRPGGANNPVPFAACEQDFTNFGIAGSPATYNSDSVDSFEIGAKNNFQNRVRISSSIYYIKWKNIQQTVVPPICQISWIDNLGKAVAKGADLQAEIAVTEAFSADLTAGYTSARYTQTPNLPTVASGDAISGESGQPAAPVTVSVGLEYRFEAFTHASFVRADYEYQGRGKWLPPTQDPNTLQYDPANFTLPATNFVSIRGGMSFGEFTVEPFIDNLLDSHTLTNYNFSIDPGTGVDTRLMRNFTFRPRTYGVTFTYRR